MGELKRLKKGSRINIQKYRVAQRQAKQKDEEQQQQKEGTTYCAGAFNELTAVKEPARKRKKKDINCDSSLENDLFIRLLLLFTTGSFL